MNASPWCSMRYAFAAAVLMLAPFESARAQPTYPRDVTVLDCKFPGRNILALVLFPKLKKLRIWYGDGGGQDWDKVDYSGDPIVTGLVDQRYVIVSADHSKVIFNDGDSEHARGRCTLMPAAEILKEWVEPKLRQNF